MQNVPYLMKKIKELAERKVKVTFVTTDYPMAQDTTLATSNTTAAATFGMQHTGHMYIAEYKNGEWSSGQLQDFQKISLSPFALCFHYGQTIFEGMKAFRMRD